MQKDTLPEAEVIEAAPKYGTLSLVVAILAFLAAVAAIVLNLVMKPDTSALEARVRAVETGVRANADNIIALSDAQSTMDEKITNVVDSGTATQTITDAMDYAYDTQTGKLTRKTDNSVIYTFEQPNNYPEEYRLVRIMGLNDSKLIVHDIGAINADYSPGPTQDYDIWLTDQLKYINLNNPSEGLRPYVVPEWKKQAAREGLEAFLQSIR